MPEYDVLFAKREGDLKKNIIKAGKEGWRVVEIDYLKTQYIIIVEKEGKAKPSTKKEEPELSDEQMAGLKKLIEESVTETTGTKETVSSDEVVLEG